jgi:hypothetical protein
MLTYADSQQGRKLLFTVWNSHLMQLISLFVNKFDKMVQVRQYLYFLYFFTTQLMQLISLFVNEFDKMVQVRQYLYVLY